MSLLGTIIWWIFGGLVSAVGWFLAGLVWCVTIVRIPVGLQCFKIGGLTLMPFNARIVANGGAGSFVLNIIWFIFGGFILWANHIFWGLLLTITIVGIPFAHQHFKLASLSLSPFGKQIVD